MFNAIIFGKEFEKNEELNCFLDIHDTKRDKSCFSYIFDGTKLSPILQ